MKKTHFILGYTSVNTIFFCVTIRILTETLESRIFLLLQFLTTQQESRKYIDIELKTLQSTSKYFVEVTVVAFDGEMLKRLGKV